MIALRDADVPQRRGWVGVLPAEWRYG